MRMLLLSPLLGIALLACGAAQTPPSTAETPSPLPTEAVSPSIEARIRSAYALTETTGVRRVDRPAPAIRGIVGERVDARLLVGAVDLTGQDHFFTPADGMERHLGVFMLRYADAATARARLQAITGQRFFEGSKILIPMTSASKGAELSVYYTETGGDAKLVALLAAVAAGQGSP